MKRTYTQAFELCDFQSAIKEKKRMWVKLEKGGRVQRFEKYHESEVYPMDSEYLERCTEKVKQQI